jgi:hypothetical protein
MRTTDATEPLFGFVRDVCDAGVGCVQRCEEK